MYLDKNKILLKITQYKQKINREVLIDNKTVCLSWGDEKSLVITFDKFKWIYCEFMGC